jgi:hypothetical protein
MKRVKPTYLRNDIPGFKASAFFTELIQTLEVKRPYAVELQVAFHRHIGLLLACLCVRLKHYADGIIT